MNGAGALVDILNGYGIDHIFCSPGSEWPPVWEELARRRATGEKAPRYFNVRHEEVAVAMAAGFAKATGRLSAVIVHTTVGTLHAGMAIRAAYHEELPMLVCAGESIDFGETEGFDPGGQWIRYLADRGGPTRFAEPCAKWSMGVISRPTLASTVHRACQIAMTPPRGPVFVSLPFEFLFQEAIGPMPTSYPRPGKAGSDREQLDLAADMLAASRRPLIITDAAGREPGAVDELVRLSELLAAPVVESTRQMYFNFPRDHALHGGVDPKPYLMDADTVFLIGAVAPWHPPSAGPGAGSKIVALDTNPLRPDLPYSGYRVDLCLTGEIATSLAAIVTRIRSKFSGSDSARLARIAELKERHDKQRRQRREQAHMAKDTRPIDPRWFCHVLNAALPDGATVVEETITHRGPIVSLLDRLSPGRYYGAESGGLGLGMGIALGVKCAAPEKPVIALIGDGTFNYNPVLAALGFSQEYELPMVTIIMNNGGYLSMKRGVTALYPHGFAAKTNSFFGWPIQPNPRYAAIAQAFDAYGETVEDPADIEPALRRAFEAERAGRTALIDLRLSPTFDAAP
jgi:acetolactate synthase-1/2/3 large subunit